MTKRRYDPVSGYMYIEGNPLTRVCVADYAGSELDSALDSNSTYGVFKSPEELSSKETLASFVGTPIIDGHAWITPRGMGGTPPEEVGIEGVVTRAYFKDGQILGDIVIHSQRMQRLIDEGKIELSCGYSQNLVRKRGTYDGKNYDFVQTDIRANHVALVDRGRMGPSVRVLDFLINIGRKDKMALKTMAMDGESVEIGKEKEEEEMDECSPKNMMKKFSDMEKKFEAMDEKISGFNDKLIKALKLSQGAVDAAKTEISKKAEDVPAPAFDAEKFAKDLEEKMKKAFDAEAEKRIADATSRIADEESKKSEIINSLVQVIGPFEVKGKSLDEICKYGVDKLGLSCFRAGDEHSILYNHLKFYGKDNRTHKIKTSFVGSSLDEETQNELSKMY